MKVIKNINNNVCICVDNNNQEAVVMGKGIGFIKPPGELDISQIQRTFYDINPNYIQMINLMPEEVIDLSIQVVDYARNQLDCLFNSNIIFTLADHINFAIKRYKENLIISMPIYYDIQHMHPKEFEIGKHAVKSVKEKFGIVLPRDEIPGIAMHIINAEAMENNNIDLVDHSKIIDSITQIIEEFLDLKIEKDSFNYSRFVSHMQYLLKRGDRGGMINSDNALMYMSLKESFPEINECAKKVNSFINEELKYDYNDEELLYLMLHINRLCAREDCYQ